MLISILIFVVDFIIGFFVGDFGFAQIIGGFQHYRRHLRSLQMTIITSIIWIIIFVLVFYATKSFLPSGIIGFYVGTIAALIAVVSAGQIE